MQTLKLKSLGVTAGCKGHNTETVIIIQFNSLLIQWVFINNVQAEQHKWQLLKQHKNKNTAQNSIDTQEKRYTNKQRNNNNNNNNNNLPCFGNCRTDTGIVVISVAILFLYRHRN
jgi:hypothetical protein